MNPAREALLDAADHIEKQAEDSYHLARRNNPGFLYHMEAIKPFRLVVLVNSDRFNFAFSNLAVHGTFASYKKAMQWAEKNVGHDDWYIYNLNEIKELQ